MRLLLIATIVLLTSCSAKIIPIKGDYPQTPMVFKSDNSFEKTWDKLVDVFAQKGLAIKIIDKSSGLIISTNSLMPASPEDSKGKIIDRNAFIVVPSFKSQNQIKPISGSNQGPYTPKSKVIFYPVHGEWNVRIKPDGSGSIINVNITNVTYQQLASASKYGPTTVSLSDYKSTGMFEKELADLIR